MAMQRFLTVVRRSWLSQRSSARGIAALAALLLLSCGASGPSGGGTGTGGAAATGGGTNVMGGASGSDAGGATAMGGSAPGGSSATGGSSGVGGSSGPMGGSSGVGGGSGPMGGSSPMGGASGTGGGTGGAGGPPGAGGSTPKACANDAACRLVSDYCTGCDCRAYASDEVPPVCPGPGVRCLVDPCMNKKVACQKGRCVVVEALPSVRPGKPYDACAGKKCGDLCRLCPPDDPTCMETAQVKQCNAQGKCGTEAPVCAGR